MELESVCHLDMGDLGVKATKSVISWGPPGPCLHWYGTVPSRLSLTFRNIAPLYSCSYGLFIAADSTSH